MLFQLTFSDAQKETFDALYAAKSKDDFALTVQIGDSNPVEAVAHLRGQTSLNCQRKSFTVNLKGPESRYLRPGLASDEFYLISLCKDDRYFRQYLDNTLAAGFDLFPLQFDMVELTVAGQTWGVYLLIEKIKEGILQENSRITTIVRRRFDPEDKAPDVEFPPGIDSTNPAVAPYWNMTAALDGLSGEELAAAADELFDLRQYLRFVAFHSLTQSGDWIDETIFYSTQAVRNGVAGHWYKASVWDTEDIFTACHHSNKFAMVDPYGMAYCAEGDLEKLLLADPYVYTLFVDSLEDLIETGLTEEVFDAALAQTASTLLPFFDRKEICEAMVELVKSNPDAVDPEVAKADIQAKMDAIKGAFLKRRDKLLSLIADFREMEASR
jgi:hypothetical protein